MRVKQNGERFSMDLSIQNHAAVLGIQQGWRGDHEQTLAYYRRIVAMALADLQYRRIAYTEHFDVALLDEATAALDKLQAHLEAEKVSA